jgi:prepilin-type processing-associated H-X9-DG protein
MGGRPLAGEDEYRLYVTESDIISPSPAQAFVVIDEHEKSINDGWFALDARGDRGFLDFPAARHDGGFTLSFADGHVEGWKLKDSRTLQWPLLPASNSPQNLDWDRLRNAATSPQ